jgi:mono/diheme cytochrome c family protein
MRRTRVPVCAAILVIALVLAFGGGCGGSTSTTPTVINVQGAELFTSFCSTCHGLRGEGGVGPDLRKTAGKDRATVESQIKNGKGTMPGFTNKLNAGQITAVADYVMQLKP